MHQGLLSAKRLGNRVHIYIFVKLFLNIFGIRFCLLLYKGLFDLLMEIIFELVCPFLVCFMGLGYNSNKNVPKSLILGMNKKTKINYFYN